MLWGRRKVRVHLAASHQIFWIEISLTHDLGSGAARKCIGFKSLVPVPFISLQLPLARLGTLEAVGTGF